MELSQNVSQQERAQAEEPLLQNRDNPVEKKSCKDSCIASCNKCKQCFNKPPAARTLFLTGETEPLKFCENIVKNTKYNILTFIPIVLYNQFKLFFNLFFLLIALTQFIPPLQVGFLITYLAPLIFVLSITMLKEAYDDLQRWRNDKQQNSYQYTALRKNGEEIHKEKVQSKDLKVGDIIEVTAGEKIPADLILLRTKEENGTVFIKTTQLDGETDWKLRKSIAITQRLPTEFDLMKIKGQIQADAPHKDIYKFEGNFQFFDGDVSKSKESLSLSHTLWCDTSVASGMVWGIIIYTGKETRIVMNSAEPQTKFGICDWELNKLSKILFTFVIIISFLMLAFYGFYENWYIVFIRYILLLSSIIPISLRVNLDMAKAMYCFFWIVNDKKIPETIPRSSTIPEELGRIQVLLSDKTGTLTQNDMVFKKLQLSQDDQKFVKSNNEIEDTVHKLVEQLHECYQQYGPLGPYPEQHENLQGSKRKSCTIIHDIMLALGLCHNVTPIFENQEKSFQAASPDEIALVKFAESIGMRLEDRKQEFITLKNIINVEEKYTILNEFPFSSERKRMGIILYYEPQQKYIFYLKGAEDIMKEKVKPIFKYQIEESCEQLAREGLRTLVITQKIITQQQYEKFKQQYEEAEFLIGNREQKKTEILNDLERDMDYLGITGVEDKLQENVRDTIEKLRSANIKVWMLTGDKMETAECIAVSTGLKGRTQKFFKLKALPKNQIQSHLENIQPENVLVVDGQTLTNILSDQEITKSFVIKALKLPSVVCCRVAPTQKTEITKSIIKYTNLRVCCIGDGGNDVGMIQSGHLGIGIVGKEGNSASLASDFSFDYLNRLILWHGRLSYKRTAVLSNFIFHRGLIVSVIQAIFTCTFYFASISVYNGWLLMGYSTLYTSLPAFMLIWDSDVNWKTVNQFPELYKPLQKGRQLNFKSFCIWVWKALYQGTIIFVLGLFLFEETESIINLQSITFTSLIFCEYLNVYTDVETYHWVMLLSSILSLTLYFMSMFFLPSVFDLDYIFTWAFLWRVLLITFIAWAPIFAIKMIITKCDAPEHHKVMETMKSRPSYRRPKALDFHG